MRKSEIEADSVKGWTVEMKKFKMAVLLVCLMFVSAAAYAAPKTSVWEGTLIDTNCYLKDHALTGNDHMGVKGCGTACLKSGLPAGILTRTKQLPMAKMRASRRNLNLGLMTGRKISC